MYCTVYYRLSNNFGQTCTSTAELIIQFCIPNFKHKYISFPIFQCEVLITRSYIIIQCYRMAFYTRRFIWHGKVFDWRKQMHVRRVRIQQKQNELCALQFTITRKDVPRDSPLSSLAPKSIWYDRLSLRRDTLLNRLLKAGIKCSRGLFFTPSAVPWHRMAFDNVSLWSYFLRAPWLAFATLGCSWYEDRCQVDSPVE